MLTKWFECVGLYYDLQNGKPGISDRIKNVDEVDFTDFIESFKSRDPSKQKEEIQAVKTVMEKIQHLKECYMWGNSTISDHDEILWDVFENVKIDELWIDNNEFSPDQMVYLARICDNCEVRSLKLWGCNLQSEHLKQFSENVAKIDELWIEDNEFSPDQMVYLARLCDNCEVKSLRLELCYLQSEHLKQFSENVAKIDELEIVFNKFSPDQMVYLARICDNCEVKSLKLEGCDLQSEHLMRFSENICGSKLENLDVSENHLVPSDIIHLIRICEICQVKTLGLGNCGLESEHLKLFAENAKNVKLENLDVSLNHLVPSDIIHVIRICEICQVKTLGLRGCGLESEHLKLFAEDVKNVKIDSLDISWNEEVFVFKPGTIAKLTGAKDSVYYLAKLCEICQVKKLDVRECNLQSDQLKKFIKLAKDTKIVEMNIDNNPDISEDAKAELQRFLERNKEKAEAEVDATAAVMDVNVRKSTRDSYESHLDDVRIYTINKRQEKGRVLIINNEFGGRGRLERRGSLVDVENQENLWKGLGFNVVVRRNLTAEEMQRTCNEFAKDLKSVSVAVVIIMTHGGNGDGKGFLEGEDREEILTEDVISTFNAEKSPHLRGIPKVFFFQACRGGDQDSGLAADATVTKYPSRSDMLIAYPSQAGFISMRHKTKGSWFMNAITNVFMRNAHDSHLADMLTMVNDAVAKKESRLGVQMCNHESYLRRKLFLFPGWPN